MTSRLQSKNRSSMDANGASVKWCGNGSALLSLGKTNLFARNLPHWQIIGIGSQWLETRSDSIRFDPLISQE
ncbi:hypothetical protein BLOT_012764 [Blomia tropicalis]|nr:hypothetical protein BLOT_012764 [Blomia tropicalis]